MLGVCVEGMQPREGCLSVGTGVWMEAQVSGGTYGEPGARKIWGCVCGGDVAQGGVLKRGYTGVDGGTG